MHEFALRKPCDRSSLKPAEQRNGAFVADGRGVQMGADSALPQRINVEQLPAVLRAVISLWAAGAAVARRLLRIARALLPAKLYAPGPASSY